VDYSSSKYYIALNELDNFTNAVIGDLVAKNLGSLLRESFLMNAQRPVLNSRVDEVIADDVLGECIHMLIIPNPSNQISVSEIKTHLRVRIEKYKIPDMFYFDVALPIRQTGKADRAQFKSQILSRVLNAAPQ